MIRRFILWAVRRATPPGGTSRYRRVPVVTFDDQFLFCRFEPFWRDERMGGGGPDRPPWWRPFNVLLHWWRPIEGTEEAMHDHPRWSITVCLRGEIVERTPWGERTLRPGSIVIRSRKAIHAFRIAPGHSGKTWTLFIVGRRNHRQSTYVVTPRATSAWSSP